MEDVLGGNQVEDMIARIIATAIAYSPVIAMAGVCIIAIAGGGR